METLLIGAQTINIATTLSKDLLFKAVYSTSMGIVNLCKYMVETNKPYMKDVNKLLSRLDIKAKITILHDLIKEQEHNELNKSVKRSLIYVSEALDNIHKELDGINKQIETHKKKWWQSYRTLDCSENLMNIDYHNKILDKRVEMLVNLLKIYSNTIKSK